MLLSSLIAILFITNGFRLMSKKSNTDEWGEPTFDAGHGDFIVGCFIFLGIILHILVK